MSGSRRLSTVGVSQSRLSLRNYDGPIARGVDGWYATTYTARRLHSMGFGAGRQQELASLAKSVRIGE